MLSKFDKLYNLIMQDLQNSKKSIIKEDCDPGFTKFVNGWSGAPSSSQMSAAQRESWKKRNATFNSAIAHGKRISEALRNVQKKHNANGLLTTHLDGRHFFFRGDYDNFYRI